MGNALKKIICGLNASDKVLDDPLAAHDELAEPLDILAATSNDVTQIGPMIKGHDVNRHNLRLAVPIQIHATPSHPIPPGPAATVYRNESKRQERY